VARAPRLGGEPLDRVVAVQLLLRHVLVLDDSFRATRAADVDARDDVAVPREILIEARSGATSSFRYGMYSMTTGSGSPGSGSGMYRLAASRIPSRIGIRMFLTTFTPSAKCTLSLRVAVFNARSAAVANGVAAARNRVDEGRAGRESRTS
jgi:hypothetical protein